jgi:predicted ATPase
MVKACISSTNPKPRSSRQLSVITRIYDLVQQRSQFIIATHSPIIMAYPEGHIYAFSTDGIERIAHKDTEHLRVTRDFLATPNACSGT